MDDELDVAAAAFAMDRRCVARDIAAHGAALFAGQDVPRAGAKLAVVDECH